MQWTRLASSCRKMKSNSLKNRTNRTLYATVSLLNLALPITNYFFFSMSSQRPDPAHLKPETYRFHVEMPTRFGDLDIRGHINNVSIVQYCEDIRVAFQMEVVGREIYVAESPLRVVV